ncbi:integrating conjugative element protein [Aromatoleum bremense]|uniref:Integrating conjugative element protein n=1 Tax=Aromatoleum bremense TaxID=76115 RepID=A0ABX1NWW4_9RHOO|nr:integrating conjugative element protein [Aromatoleum bremense]NMG16271.1 integrating conjugative element protein [Aromatoleum bremense]QTQ30083.1 Uncharacterized protein pbN1_00900 [Aromatoleum bremense]
MKKGLLPLLLLPVLADVRAVDTATTEVAATRPGITDRQFAGTSDTGVSSTDILEARYWGITVEELQRARILMRGPRGAFSDPRISPVEVLGVHARSDAERTRYGELFARLLHDDAERVLAWQRAGTEAMRRLYPNDKVVDFSGLRPASAKGKVLPNWFFAPGASRE